MASQELIQSDSYAGSLTVPNVIDKQHTSWRQARCQKVQALLGRIIDVHVNMTERNVVQIDAFCCGREKTPHCPRVWF
jgi:hypothetical protein